MTNNLDLLRVFDDGTTKGMESFHEGASQENWDRLSDGTGGGYVTLSQYEPLEVVSKLSSLGQMSDQVSEVLPPKLYFPKLDSNALRNESTLD